jgi:hypothetical protein
MNLLKLLQAHKQTGYFAALLLMTLPAAGLYWAANNASMVWIWIGIGLVIMGNLITLLIK